MAILNVFPIGDSFLCVLCTVDLDPSMARDPALSSRNVSLATHKRDGSIFVDLSVGLCELQHSRSDSDRELAKESERTVPFRPHGSARLIGFFAGTVCERVNKQARIAENGDFLTELCSIRRRRLTLVQEKPEVL